MSSCGANLEVKFCSRKGGVIATTPAISLFRAAQSIARPPPNENPTTTRWLQSNFRVA
ncbi:MAG: hypothetical protein PHU01_10365 [Desulfuromonadaceae bacterium]|nr:hypothetical protein [Desulfuromonadaceae bacterium]